MTGAVVFVDPIAPRAYSGAPGALAGLGGTEATLVRVAEALVLRRAVTVRQRARPAGSEHVGGVRYEGFDPEAAQADAATTVVVINSWKVALKQRRLNPRNRVLLWLHVFPGRHNRAMGAALRAAGVEVVCVSASQARWMRAFLGETAPAITHVHNPVDDALVPDGTERDPNLLLFASSPHKGLDQVYRRFEALRVRWPELRLAVADPGYLAWTVPPGPAGVRRLGRLDHRALIGWMRRALCLFQPQDSFAETFGLVIAEANAVGCPALLQRGLGANDEVASSAAQCIDVADPDAVARFVAERRRTLVPPEPIAMRPEFRQAAVTARWNDLLRSGPMRSSRPLPPSDLAPDPAPFHAPLRDARAC